MLAAPGAFPLHTKIRAGRRGPRSVEQQKGNERMGADR